ncbi:MAG TPA: response regulator [Bryobacteraceae bacterium]|nr:response regulator [Bryobacteraceae bacterium]
MPEDYLDNRLLMQAYLKSSPHQLKSVEDGKSAVDILQTDSFDLVFMDIQMPVMDGLTATTAIRALERERHTEPTPIVALTANARREDIERSRAAGCTAHLSKPISKQRLVEAIRQYGRPRDLNRAQAIRVEVHPDLEELVPGYLADRKQDVPELLALLAASDFERLRSKAHNLKGTGASYGFPRLSEVGAALERCAKGQDAAGAGEQLTQLKDYLSRVQLVTRPA